MNSAPVCPPRPVHFPGWVPALVADESLPPPLREAYRQTLSRFLAFCSQRKLAPAVTAAREFVELAQLEQGPSPARLQEWKDALNWYFKKGRGVSAVMLRGVPPLARADLGGPAWEVALIAHLRQRGRSWRTEQTYRGWLWRFVKWLECRAKDRKGSGAVTEAGRPEVEAFLSMLAAEERVTVATQKQALNALVVFFRDVEGRELGEFKFERARKRIRVPVVLNRTECEQLFDAMEGTARLMAELMFGSGIRLMELLRLRIKDVATTQIYTHVMQKPGLGVKSPLDG